MVQNNKTDNTISRRSVLRSCAAGAGVGAGVVGASAGAVAKRTARPDELERLERSPKVQSVLEELGHGSLTRRGRAETTEVEGESFVLRVTAIDFGYGELLIGTVNDELSVAFTFDPTAAATSPNSAYADIPAGVDAWLLGTETGATFLRTATARERKATLSAVPAGDVESALVYTRSDLEGFHVDVLDPDEAGVDPDATDVTVEKGASERTGEGGTANEFVRYHVVPSGAAAASISVASAEYQAAWLTEPAKVVAKKIITTFGFAGLGTLTDSCAVKAVGCIASFSGSIAGCAKCAPACLGSPTGVGAVICVLCVFGVCSHLLSGVSCSNAMNCISNA